MGTNSGGFDIPEIQVHPPSPDLRSCTCPESSPVGGDGDACDVTCCPGKQGQEEGSSLLSVPHSRADQYLYKYLGRAPKCSGKCMLAEAGKLAPNQTLYVQGSPEMRRAHPRSRRKDDTPYIDPIDALRSNPSLDLSEEAGYTEPYNSRKNSAYRWKSAKDYLETEERSRYENAATEDVSKGATTSPVHPHQCVCQCGRNIAAAQEGVESLSATEESQNSDTSSTNVRETEPENHDYHVAKPADPTICEPYMVTNMTAITQEWQPSCNDIKSSVDGHGNGVEENNQYEVIPDHAEAALEERINMEEDAIRRENRGHYFFLFLFLLLFVAGIVCLILRFSTSTSQNAQLSTANMNGHLQLHP
ncbi:uncharacterized protein LOC118411380 [Branchiostoma floridae]|uniref:Uncharacterized protein LOC118411380 n=1 Tax=Branchiostoma floridae TaxID=7739 RepID=C3YDR8_BRAFL|nr:uncharacterized protein LOC118411380 [Branchiostoma floridae]|eukprot:XP_002605527.1 hypothetical protein BRAFLDRAFT_104095 [Branchiostoma floridae]